MALSSGIKSSGKMTRIKAILALCIVLTAVMNLSVQNTLVAMGAKRSDGCKDNPECAKNKENRLQSMAKRNTKINPIKDRRISVESPSEQATVPSDLSSLPSALHPADAKDCCPVEHLPRSAQNPKCGETCFTKEACTSKLYPYRSEKEKLFLKQNNVPQRHTDEYRQYLDKFRKPCNEKNSLRRPPYEWCQQWKTPSETIDPYAANLPPPGCSIFNSGGGSGAYQHLILFPEAKLAFCGIPKVGVTQWYQFLRFTLGAKDYQSFPHAKPEVFTMRFDRLMPEVQAEILNDPDWKFAAFLRDPAERLLSAYLDKVASDKPAESKHFQRIYNLNHTLEFEEFIDLLGEEKEHCPSKPDEDKFGRIKGVDWCSNPHWRPQTFSCGLSEFLPRFSYIGSLNNIEHQSRSLLQKVGLWENYGRFYHWDDKETSRGDYCRMHPPALSAGETLTGFQQSRSKGKRANVTNVDTTYGHSTNAQSKIDKYYTPRMLEKVKKLYIHDYKVWDLIHDKESLTSGISLAMQISSDCEKKGKQRNIKDE